MTLLADVQRRVERLYGRSAGVDLSACVVGPKRCAELADRAAGACGEMIDWARFFYYTEHANLRLALFFADEMIEVLETLDPRVALSDLNVMPFLVFSEECSHAFHTSVAFAEGGPDRVYASHFPAELEVMARIDAYLLLSWLVRELKPRYTEVDRAWVREQALRRWDIAYEEPECEARYRTGTRMAGALIDRLRGQPPATRLSAIRDFRAMPLEVKERTLEQPPLRTAVHRADRPSEREGSAPRNGG